MKKTKVILILCAGVLLTFLACSSKPQPTIMDLLIHLEKSGIEVDTQPITPQEKEAFERFSKRLATLKKRYAPLLKLLGREKKKEDYAEMKVVALDGLRTIIYRYKSTKDALLAYRELSLKEKLREKRASPKSPFPPLRNTLLLRGPFLLKIPHWRPKVVKGELQLFPPEIIEPDRETIAKIQRALELFPIQT